MAQGAGGEVCGAVGEGADLANAGVGDMEKVTGLGLGWVFFMKFSAPLVMALEMYEEVVTISRDAVAEVWTMVES